MQRLFVLVGSFLLFAGQFCASAQPPSPRAALAELDADTPSVVYFYKSGSEACRQFEDAVNLHHGVAALAGSFRWYQVDVGDPTCASVVKTFGILQPPAVCLLQPKSEDITRLGSGLSADALYGAMAKSIETTQPRTGVTPPLKFSNTAGAIDPKTLAQLTAAAESLNAATNSVAAPTSVATSTPAVAAVATAAPAAAAIGTPVELDDPADQSAATGRDLLSAKVARVGDQLVFTMHFVGAAQPLVHIFINADNAAQTGFQTANMQGADLLIENASLFTHSGSPQDWNWQPVGNVTSAPAGNDLTITVPLSLSGLKPGQKIQIAFGTYDDKFATVDCMPNANAVAWTIPQ
jgi:hypothetical protein